MTLYNPQSSSICKNSIYYPTNATIEISLQCNCINGKCKYTQI